MLRYFLLLTYVPLLLELLRQGYDPLMTGFGQLHKSGRHQLSELMVCHCRVCISRRKLGQNTFH